MIQISMARNLQLMIPKIYIQKNKEKTTSKRSTPGYVNYHTMDNHTLYKENSAKQPKKTKQNKKVGKP